MKILLKENELLLDFFKKTRKANINYNCIKYAEEVFNSIIDFDTRRLTKKHDVDKFELIIIKTKPLSSYKIRSKTTSENDARLLLLLKLILKGKRIYFSRLIMVDGCFDFTKPEQIIFDIEKPNTPILKRISKKLNKKQKSEQKNTKHYEKINRYLFKINKEAINGLINSAKRDFDFIFHFNNEMFYQNIKGKGISFSKDAVLGIYENEKYTKIIDLSDARERMAFISLYAISFYGLSLNDLYSVDGIFSIQNNRETDEKKRLAGQDVFNLIFNENRDNIRKHALIMGEAINNLPLPDIDLNINTLIKKNYSLYIGLNDIGKVFSNLILSTDDSFEKSQITARRLSHYKILENLYEEILRTDGDYSNKDIYKNAKALANFTFGKRFSRELDFNL